MLQFLNIFFLVFHTALILFNCVGWIWKRTRLWHLATIALTSLSWFVLGIWYGWGYCLCTDWHWQVREQLGYPNDHSYTHLLIQSVTGLDLNPDLTDTITVGVYVAVTLLTLVLNAKDWRQRMRSKPLLNGRV